MKKKDKTRGNDTQKLNCPACGILVEMPKGWEGREEDCLCNACWKEFTTGEVEGD